MAIALVRTALRAGASVAAALGAAGLAARPWFMRWGATEEEAGKTWPGDELSPRPASQATRAVTINAPAAAVWPWLAQIGQDRGGFYSYTWFENLLGARMRNADRIHPEFRHRVVGENVWTAPPDRYGDLGRQVVVRLEPGRALVLASAKDAPEALAGRPAAGGTWAFILEPVDERTTRLVVRSRSGPRLGPASGAFRYLVFDPLHFVMERGMMLGIKRRAEAAATAPPVASP